MSNGSNCRPFGVLGFYVKNYDFVVRKTAKFMILTVLFSGDEFDFFRLFFSCIKTRVWVLLQTYYYFFLFLFLFKRVFRRCLDNGYT